MSFNQLIEFVAHHRLLVLMGVLLACAVAALEVWRRATGSKEITSNEAIRLMNREDAMVLDLRSATDFEKCHIPGAKHAQPEQWPEHLNVLLPLSLSKNTPLLLYTATGKPSYHFIHFLKAHGFKRCYHLQNGLQAWQAAGLPLT